ncbi:Zinc finger CCCH domain-containing protein 4 [Acorus calamus]|uniref:Zinc finger CCCH domain-containing protein 4 n=1 Tax=Acorus calamus TaxID=4465 RepID=A0AAV9EW62_ACOCL|nr:Zinc finger CCCH domain-containing protein 4 [Acorus calamus]
MASSSSLPPPSYSSSQLPVMALRDKIVEKIMENRVTLIVGETGCGKSSQVPQFLLDENVEPILCTQPRRFAVVAIAGMVAAARNCAVGEEVGYHIGHSNVSNASTTRSKIVFKTAGVLLEQMRDKGLAALKYKVIILDEVHERSVESDLVLACVKQFMQRNNDLRVVLMSATADISRYRDYFKDLGRGERVEVLAIPSSPKQTIFQRKVLYLEQVAELLGKNMESFLSQYCPGVGPNFADAEMKPDVHKLIHELVLHIHENEPDIEKSILIFLPTYISLEQQWLLLRPLNSIFKVHILHRSIDTDQALQSMTIWKSHRKVILSTNIAESSVTIPGVAFVIDSCRSLQVFWDHTSKKDATELVWVSKSQAEQRKGRTGRTCDGQIYRLVSQTFYKNMNEHDFPSILRLSLRHQVLMMCCAESKAINDPRVLLQKVLDPPHPEFIDDALSLLVHINALESSVSHRGRYEPTFHGRLLDSLPLSFDASVLVLKFGEIGLLREGILIGILMDLQPLPILQPFGEQSLCRMYLESYFEGSNESLAQIGKKENIFLGNFCAFQFWQCVFKDKHRLERLRQIINDDDPGVVLSLISTLEKEWCQLHHLLMTSLHHVSDISDYILNAMHRFRPKFFVTTSGLPTYYEPYDYHHICLLQSQSAVRDPGADAQNNEDLVPSSESKCLALPFVSSRDFQVNDVAKSLAEAIKKTRVQYTEGMSWNEAYDLDNGIIFGTNEVSLCKFFIRGLCNRGDQCAFSHSLQAKRPVCKFFFTYQGCRNGDSCFFSHDNVPSSISFDTPSLCLQEDEEASASNFLHLLPESDDGRVLVLNDKDLHFTSKILVHYDKSKIIVTTPEPLSADAELYSRGLKVLHDDNHTFHSIISNKANMSIPWKKVQCVLLFVEFKDIDNMSIQSQVLQRFFEFLAIRILADTLYNDLLLILTMNSYRFAQLEVEKLARDCFFFLTDSFPFDERTLGKFSNGIKLGRPMQSERPITYLFEMHPPSRAQFGDYASQFRRGLHSSHQ